VSTGLAVLPLSIPSPGTGVWNVLGFPVRAYALCIIAGIVLALLIARRRWRARGGDPDSLEAVVVIAIPFGIVGARLYHVLTDYQLYVGPGRDPVDALRIWNGGLGIWGAIALGVLGGYLVARRRRIRFAALLAPRASYCTAYGTSTVASGRLVVVMPTCE
jgi:prolipoprotein diacylglyceryltransferase